MALRETVVDCPHCQTRVRASVKASHFVSLGDKQNPGPIDHRVGLVVCPGCDAPLLVREECMGEYGDEIEWGDPLRVWPEPQRAADAAIPAIVQVSLDEADRCHRAGAHTACAVMCGRALEGICVHAGIKSMLAKGLQELHSRGLIDKRLLEWGDALREVRNLAAHATGEKISKEDSTDLLHFVAAICDYIYVLTARFDAFKARRAAAAAASAPSEPTT